MENNEFEIGDVVELNGNSSLKMTISFVGATSVNLLYINNGKVEKINEIPKKCLTKTNKFIDNERTKLIVSDDQKRFLMNKKTEEELFEDIKTLTDSYPNFYVFKGNFKNDLIELLKKSLNPLNTLTNYIRSLHYTELADPIILDLIKELESNNNNNNI